MKKFLSIITAALISTFAFAELHPTYRIFEISINGLLGFDQNLTTVEDILVPELVIDLPKIADGFGKKGFVSNSQFEFDFAANLNLNKNLKIGTYVNTDFSGNFEIGKGFWDLLAYGNELDNPVVADIHVNGQLFMNAGASLQMGFKKFTFRANPSIYLPLVYIPNPTAFVTAQANSDGKLIATAEAYFDAYSCLPVDIFVMSKEGGGIGFHTGDEIMESLQSYLDPSVIFSTLWSNGGFDIGGEVEYELFRFLDIGGYLNMPLKPAYLKQKFSGSVKATAEVNDLLSWATDQSEEKENPWSSSFESNDISFSQSNFSVNRPFRFGCEACFRPIGKWLTVRGKLGYAARNPFGEDFDWKDNSYLEYYFGLESRLFYILGLKLYTSYQQEAFTQGFGLDLNMRVLELNFNISSTGASFVKSFKVSGIRGSLGLKFGF